jgi:phage terminase small subunit
MRNEAAKRMQSLLGEFGLTPAARARVLKVIPKNGEKNDLVATFFD